jgi:hypothetical protein
MLVAHDHSWRSCCVMASTVRLCKTCAIWVSPAGVFVERLLTHIQQGKQDTCASRSLLYQYLVVLVVVTQDV